jgi:hypothetical protein
VSQLCVNALLATRVILITDGIRGEFRHRQLPRAVDSKGRFLFLVVVKC